MISELITKVTLADTNTSLWQINMNKAATATATSHGKRCKSTAKHILGQNVDRTIDMLTLNRSTGTIVFVYSSSLSLYVQRSLFTPSNYKYSYVFPSVCLFVCFLVCLLVGLLNELTRVNFRDSLL